MRARRRLAVAVFALLGGCDASTSLLVDLKTDMVPGEEFVRVRTVVREAATDVVLREQERSVEPTDDYLAGRRAAEIDGLEPGDYLVRVELLGGDGRQIVQRAVLVSLQRTAAVTVIVTRSCRGVTCPGAGDSTQATECLAGRCVAPGCIDLDECSSPACEVDADCAFPADCATPLCDEGVCFAGTTAAACGDGEYCDPELGCRARTTSRADGGAPTDAGPPASCASDADCDDSVACTIDRCDGGTCTETPDDAACTDGADGLCVAGFGCQYAGCTPSSCVAGPCETARCDGDTCVIEPTCEAGVEECCAGACVPVGCDDGDPCTDDACGATGCAHSPNTDPCDDGVFCNGADSCSGGACSAHAGDPCSGASVCDEGTDRCVGCVTTSDCPAPVTGPWSSCTYADGCAESGSRDRTVTTYACTAGTCQPSTSTDTDTCIRDTDGATCGTTTYGPWGTCGSFSGVCDESGTRSRTQTDRVCAAGSCSTVSSSDTGSCVRDTDGTTCMSSTYGVWGTCGGFSGTCDETGTRSRSRTDYTCVSGGCAASSPVSEMGSCTRSTDGTSCGSSTFTAWGSCGGYSDACDETGTQSRIRTDYVCGSGSCSGVDTVETRSCTRDTDGTVCSSPTYGPWGACGGFSSTCDETGTQSRTRTDYACVAGTCTGSDSGESQSCSRSTDGNSCFDNARCRNGSCSSGTCTATGPLCSGRCCAPDPFCVCSTCACP